MEETGRLNSLPIDIETIAESDLGLNIIPVPDLQTVIDTDAFLSANLRDICVDRFVFEKRLNRYRFTLAHEVGHLKLHSQIYAQQHFKNSEEWKNWHEQLSEDNRFWLETHANDFAGHLLVPITHLQSKFFDILPEAKEKIRACADMGLPKHEALDNALSWIADRISPGFQVSSMVVRIRLEREKLVEKYLQE